MTDQEALATQKFEEDDEAEEGEEEEEEEREEIQEGKISDVQNRKLYKIEVLLIAEELPKPTEVEAEHKEPEADQEHEPDEEEIEHIKPKKLPNQFNFCERAALTYSNPLRVRLYKFISNKI